MAYAETRDGAKIYYKDWGVGNPVILIHGWPLSSDSWDPVADALANAGHRVIAYDRRGFGRSEQTWGGYDYDSFADDLADVMKAAGAASNVTLVGFSMGGGEVAFLNGDDVIVHEAEEQMIDPVLPMGTF